MRPAPLFLLEDYQFLSLSSKLGAVQLAKLCTDSHSPGHRQATGQKPGQAAILLASVAQPTPIAGSCWRPGHVLPAPPPARYLHRPVPSFEAGDGRTPATTLPRQRRQQPGVRSLLDGRNVQGPPAERHTCLARRSSKRPQTDDPLPAGGRRASLARQNSQQGPVHPRAASFQACAPLRQPAGGRDRPRGSPIPARRAAGRERRRRPRRGCWPHSAGCRCAPWPSRWGNAAPAHNQRRCPCLR
jgi:hypothetical protein